MPFETIRKRKEEGDIRRAKEKAEALAESQRQATLIKQGIEKYKILRTRHGSLIGSVLQALRDTGYFSGVIKSPVQNPEPSAPNELIWTFGEERRYHKSAIHIQVIINTSDGTWYCSRSRYFGEQKKFSLEVLSSENLEKEIIRVIDDKTPEPYCETQTY